MGTATRPGLRVAIARWIDDNFLARAYGLASGAAMMM